MKTLAKFLYLFLPILGIFCLTASAETIILDDDEIIQGKITRYASDKLAIETKTGTREIPISSIRLIDYLSTAQKYQQTDEAGNKFIFHLKNGEVIEGIIRQFSAEILTLDSPEGYGPLQIPISSVNFITTGSSHIDLNQRDAIGYVQRRSTLNTPSGLTSYTSNQISYKFFIDKTLFGNILLAYGNASYNGDKLQLLSLDYRMGNIFKKMQNIALYYGGSIGYMQIKDDTQNVDGSGTGYSVFAGAEIFFHALPNFGFSGEIGYSSKKADEYESSDLSISSFPAFSVHYYF